MLVGWLVGRWACLASGWMDGWSSVSCWAERGKRGTRAGAGERDKATMTAAASSIHHTSATSLTVPLRPRARERLGRERGSQRKRIASSSWSPDMPDNRIQTRFTGHFQVASGSFCKESDRHGSNQIQHWLTS